MKEASHMITPIYIWVELNMEYKYSELHKKHSKFKDSGTSLCVRGLDSWKGAIPPLENFS